MTALMLASGWNQEVEVARALLAAGSEVNARNVNGMTPLMIAATYNPDASL